MLKRHECVDLISEHVLAMHASKELSALDAAASFERSAQAEAAEEVQVTMGREVMGALEFVRGNALGVEEQREGFLDKSWQMMGYTQFRPHWCSVGGGFFWYYDYHTTDAPALHFENPERVLCLLKAQVSVVEEEAAGAEAKDAQQHPAGCCFLLEAPDYARTFRAESPQVCMEWVKAIIVHTRQFLGNPNSSFSPARLRTNAYWFVDGETTFQAMYESMSNAKYRIFITDWFLSPQVFLCRPANSTGPRPPDEYRLDIVLKKAAERGVLVYVLPWNETKIALNLDSEYVKECLEGAHKNIRVLRHPITFPIKWSHHQKSLVVDDCVAYVGGLDLCYGRWDTSEHTLVDAGTTQRWPGKDYYNPFHNELDQVDQPWEDATDRSTKPRMPWHDVHLKIEGDAARDVAFNFIQRWNHHKVAVDASVPYIAPTTPSNVSESLSHGCRCQIVRSIAEWSGGMGRGKEKSIYQAYLSAIEAAEHFIYIENQFFISSLAGQVVRNRIAEAILKRVTRAIESCEVFRVIVVVPVYPEGTFKESASIRYIMKWQFETISRGGHSLLEQLYAAYDKETVDQYISFYSLRNYGFLGGNAVTEQIYVHAKLLIVDDRTAIIGSANINDRSMFGDRDSELGAIVDGGAQVTSSMNGRPYRVSDFVHRLRLALWVEHLGMEMSQRPLLADPISDHIYHGVWKRTADANSAIYKSIFAHDYFVPHTREVQRLLNETRGHLINFDLEFLIDSPLAPTMTDLDIVLTSDDVFT
eukprot:TRINITY_DN660_c1_g1_i1.p1 TRINITY_DN660_c1_g1~~TRINITY_DN660_c1_g1_i1.p1  ORF type:complete len:818 (+),score=198.65 TRINITY_DN660_c1_g1_i1:184-2454(+)